jgi:alkylated DNA repair dioxygenase AlkB
VDEVVVDRDGLATYAPAFLDPARADGLLHALSSTCAWSQEFLTMYGKQIPFPRLTAWYGDPDATYRYSGTLHVPRPWIAELSGVRDQLAAHTTTRFNSVLLNQYRTGDDGMSWHSDDEPELGEQPFIASVSLGATRTFQLRHRGDGAVVSVRLEHGSLLLMSGSLQHAWTHRIPKERASTGARVNLTFRVTGSAPRMGQWLRRRR